MKLKTLSLVTSVLFLISIVVYVNENRRGTDLLSGSDYIKGLDINRVQKIVLSFDKEKQIALTRDSNKFVLENYKLYPAATNKVNDLIYKIASIQVREKVAVGVDEEALKKYELGRQNRKYFVELYDENGKRTVAFRVGKKHKGKGNYLFKEGASDVYLSQDNLWLNSSYKDFINTALLSLDKEEVEKILLGKGDNDEVIEEKKVKKIAEKFSNIHFTDFYAVTEPRVQSIKFDKNIKIQLKNKLVYNLSLAEDKDEHLLKLNAFLEDVPSQFVVGRDDSKEELQKIEDVIKAQGDAQRVNSERAAWVYKLDKSTYEKIIQ